MPGPAGTSRSQTATWGRSFTAFVEIVTLDGVNPGALASNTMFPAALVDCTRAMQRPEKALRGLHQGHAEAGKGLARSALIGFVVGWVAVAGADHFTLAGDPETHLVIGDRHVAALRVLHFDREH